MVICLRMWRSGVKVSSSSMGCGLDLVAREVGAVLKL